MSSYKEKYHKEYNRIIEDYVVTGSNIFHFSDENRDMFEHLMANLGSELMDLALKGIDWAMQEAEGETKKKLRKEDIRKPFKEESAPPLIVHVGGKEVEIEHDGIVAPAYKEGEEGSRLVYCHNGEATVTVCDESVEELLDILNNHPDYRIYDYDEDEVE